MILRMKRFWKDKFIPVTLTQSPNDYHQFTDWVKVTLSKLTNHWADPHKMHIVSLQKKQTVKEHFFLCTSGKRSADPSDCITFSPRTFFHTVHRKLREIAWQQQACTTSFDFLALHKTQRTVNHQMGLRSGGGRPVILFSCWNRRLLVRVLGY